MLWVLYSTSPVSSVGRAGDWKSPCRWFVKENSSDHKGIEIALANKVKRPEFINYDEKKRVATYVRYPERSELNADINESLIVEFYNK